MSELSSSVWLATEQPTNATWALQRGTSESPATYPMRTSFPSISEIVLILMSLCITSPASFVSSAGLPESSCGANVEGCAVSPANQAEASAQVALAELRAELPIVRQLLENETLHKDPAFNEFHAQLSAAVQLQQSPCRADLIARAPLLVQSLRAARTQLEANVGTLFAWAEIARAKGTTEEFLRIPDRFVTRGKLAPRDLAPTHEEMEMMLEFDQLDWG